jgi:hypothetical protein
VIKDDQNCRAAPLDESPELATLSDADYEQMYNLLYAYRFGAISFLELLDKFEVILHIDASQASRQPDPT